MGRAIIQDDTGNRSSFRLMFIIVQSIMVISVITILFVFIKESYQETPNYTGLASVISSLLGSSVLNFGLKALHKKFEK